MPAIWTDADDCVTRIHYREEQLTDEQLEDATIVDSVPDNDAAEDERDTLYYSDAERFTYEYTSYPTRLKLPHGEGTRLKDAVEAGDLATVVDIIDKLGRR